MGTVIWLCITTISGYFIGTHFYSTIPHIVLISSGLGFLFGILTRLIAAGGSYSSDIIDASFDMFD